MNKAVFLDRDGVINKNDPEFIEKTSYYVQSWNYFEFIPNIFKPLKKIQEKGYLLVIISNQPGVGKGIFSEEALEEITNKMIDVFKKKKIKIAKVYYCIHKEEDRCNCRKPLLGLIFKAKKELGISLNNSYLIGDKTSDIETGKRASCKTILLLTGYGGKDNKYKVSPDYIVNNLNEAAKIILK